MSAVSGLPAYRPGPTPEQCEHYGLSPWATADELDAAVLAAPAELIRAVIAAERGEQVPETDDEAEPDDEKGFRSSWEPEPLGPWLDGLLRPPTPALLMRDDGQPLLYPGKIHTFQGESESCKTWLALLAAAQVIEGGGRVAYVDYEDCPATLVERLSALGVERSAIGGRCHYVSPTGWDRTADNLHETLLRGVSLVIIDGVTEAMASMNLDPLDAADVARWARRLRTFATAGCAVVQIDHVTKSSETRGRYALGSVHKLNSVDGAAYVVEGVKPFGRGLSGLSRISIAKDRPGAVRGAATGSRIATLHLASDPAAGAVTLRLEPPETSTTPSGGFRPTTLMQRVAAVLATGPDEGQSGHQIESQVTGKAAAVRQAVAALVEEGYVRVETRGQKRLHTLTRPFEGGHE